MVIFTCEEDFEAMLTCIYDAWAARLGHGNIRLLLEPVTEPELFATYRHVESDPKKAGKVAAYIQKNISPAAFRMVYGAALHESRERLDAIYRFLVYGFHFGERALDMFGEPAVSRVFSLYRKVQNETHFFREFTRFALAPPQIFFAEIEPKCQVLPLLAPHFVDRMPSEYWIIVDKRRRIAAVHPKDEEFYLTNLTNEELMQMEAARKDRDPFVSLWKSFFAVIGIEQRKNARCQQSMLPLWYRKHMTEFQ